NIDVILRFPGQVADAHSALYYNYFRDYDPETGRYVESDPIGLDGGLNTYGYVGGNPLISVDYYGLSAMSQAAGNAVAGIIAGTAAGSTGHQSDSTLGGWGEGGGSSGRERESRDQNAVYKGRQTTPNPISHGEENRIIKMGNFPPMHDCEALKRAIHNLRKTIEWRRGDLNPAERGTMNYVGHVTRIRILRETLGALERAYRSRCGDPAECGSAN
ncbi:RHS repeat-associated core domain-containing protein, partial [Pseudomonas tohonis]|uniref:RHS repeat-associated core domain-containing protein n=1 Tax=Pseudomonas tohonis TaxID=2725477 RepID=UPI001F417115